MSIQVFTFNPFQQNMCVIFDAQDKSCVIIDPGCYHKQEQENLHDFITSNNLKPSRLLNTHCHLDHVFGNAYVNRTWQVGLEMHEADLPTLGMVAKSCAIYGIPGYEDSPEPTNFLSEKDQIVFGSITLDILFVPGHAPGHIAFVNHKDGYVVNGDCLFQGSIGRTDLPGGDFDTLERSIREKLYQLPDDYIVYSGHGPTTTIGNEKKFGWFKV